jgi:uncharacterized oligopeptide transporter (OPT) family protein
MARNSSVERERIEFDDEGITTNRDDGGGGRIMVEKVFKDTEVPPWTKQITIRSMVTSFLLSIIFNFIVCKLNLTTGVIPSLNVAAGLLGFAVVRGYTTLLERCGLLKQPFTRQENTVIQTCVVASSGVAFSSRFFNFFSFSFSFRSFDICYIYLVLLITQLDCIIWLKKLIVVVGVV